MITNFELFGLKPHDIKQISGFWPNIKNSLVLPHLDWHHLGNQRKAPKWAPVGFTAKQMDLKQAKYHYFCHAKLLGPLAYKIRIDLNFEFLRKISLCWIGSGKRAVNDQNDPKNPKNQFSTLKTFEILDPWPI